MRQLLQKHVEFAWYTPQQKSFQKVKDIVIQTPGPELAYYDPSKELILQVDASKYGLGATLIQEGRPLAYALQRSIMSKLRMRCMQFYLMLNVSTNLFMVAMS